MRSSRQESLDHYHLRIEACTYHPVRVIWVVSGTVSLKGGSVALAYLFPTILLSKDNEQVVQTRSTICTFHLELRKHTRQLAR